MNESGAPPSMVGCYAVIFSSHRTDADAAGYSDMADAMERLAREQPGFLTIESARGADGFGITVSYWESLEAIDAWRNQAQHLFAQRLGIERWYASYQLRVARVVRESNSPTQARSASEGEKA